MEFLSALWLPILAAGVFVFLVSSVLHMVIPIHKNDFLQLPNEDKVMAALRASGVRPGQYMFPRANSMKECSSPEMQAKFKQGPVGSIIVLPDGMPSIGKALLLWFIFSLLMGAFAGYLAWHTLGQGAPYLTVFRVTGTVAFVGYGASCIIDSIWKGVSWGTTFKFMVDGMLYALVTGGAFGWLWPAATAAV
ncbi:MAG: hypothetical protein ACT4PU_09060 [Planctomycetota bacterium]